MKTNITLNFKAPCKYYELFCISRNCKSQPVKVVCEFVRNLKMYLFFLPVELCFEVSAVFSSWKLHSPFSLRESLFIFLMQCYVWHMYYMTVITSDLILLKKNFIYYQPVEKLRLCNSKVSSDKREQDERSYLYRAPIMTQQQHPRILCSLHSSNAEWE